MYFSSKKNNATTIKLNMNGLKESPKSSHNTENEKDQPKIRDESFQRGEKLTAYPCKGLPQLTYPSIKS